MNLRRVDISRAATVVGTLVHEKIQQESNRIVKCDLRDTVQNYLGHCKRVRRRPTLQDLHTLEVMHTDKLSEHVQQKKLLQLCVENNGTVAALKQAIGALICALYRDAHGACSQTVTPLPAHSFNQFAVGVIYSFARGIHLNDVVLVPICPLLIDILPEARLQNASRTRRARSTKTAHVHRGTFRMARLSAHKGALVLQAALRSTCEAMERFEDQNNLWRSSAQLAKAVETEYESIVQYILHTCSHSSVDGSGKL